MEQNRTDKKQEMINMTDRAINELVYEKTQIIKAYNYYHCKRDPEQFRHLEENYGIGTPTSIEFIPLTRKHIDVLIGEYLSTPVLPRISCKDSSTLSNIFREKQLKINETLTKELSKYLNNTLYAAISGNKQDTTDKEVSKRLTDLQESLDRNFISEYEIAGQNIINWIIQSRNIDFTNQRKTLITDLLVSGTGYYRIFPSSDKTNIELKILNPINTFIDRNPESPYLKNSSRAVIREYLTKDQILAKYGEFLTSEDLSELDSYKDYSIDGSATSYIRSFESVTGQPIDTDGVLGGFEVTPLLPYERNNSKFFRLYPVYDVEWLKTEKEGNDYIVNRYETIRIGANIYILKGKCENVIRSIDNKRFCSLSINGMFYSDRNGEPYSLILKTANLQDRNDILHFYRDCVIAESGGIGDWLDVAHLPKFLGSDVEERLMKWKAYKKSGIALIDSSQEGTQMANTTFGGYDDTIKLQTIQALDLAIQRNETTCSMITGIFQERLGGIEQKDAVTNVQVGIRQSSFITKQYYQVMDLLTREVLIDSLDMAKIVYKKGLSGTLILGERLNRIFTALPKYYTVTDFDVHIADSSEAIKEQEIIKQYGIELIKTGNIDPDTVLEIITATGLTKMKEDVKASILRKSQENNQLGQLQQQSEQLQEELKRLQQENQKLQQQLQKNNQEKIMLEEEKFQFDKELGWYEAKNLKEYNEAKIEWEKKRVQLEGLQLLDDNQQNNEVKNK